MEFIMDKEEFDAIEAVVSKHKDIRLAGDKYIIRPFKDWFECIKEGRELHHAVQFYAKAKYARGKDYLFVMRRVDEPDTPFITLEFDLDGNLLLAKKQDNYDAKEKDEIEFIERFRLEALMPYINEQNNRNYINLLDEFCKEFAPYVADNWWENNLNIYIYLDEEPTRIVCYGLDRANWSGISNSDYSFDESLQELISEVPTGTQEIYVQITCGRMDKIKLRTE